MSFRDFLIHRCTLVKQGQKTGEDSYGRPIYGETEINDVSCRADQMRSRSSRDERGIDYIIENILFFSSDVKIEEDMIVKNIIDIDGNPVLSGSFSIQDIHTIYGRLFLHHYEVSLQKVDDT